MLASNINRVDRSAATRARLQACAVQLFTARGFDGTTVAQVARAAGVTPMTFFRHFPTKESVVLDDPYDPLLVAAVQQQPPGLAPLEQVRRAVRDAWAGLPEPDEEGTRTRVRLVAGHPGLRAAAVQANDTTLQAVATALVARGTDPFPARVASAAVLGALTTALLDWGADDGGQPLGDRVRAALDVLAPPPSTG